MLIRITRKRMLFLVSLVLLAYVGVMIVESRKPALPAVRTAEGRPQGYVFVSMLVDLVEAQTEGPGGWTPNDLPLTPGYWLDNLPSFQMGVMSVVRRVTLLLRDDLGRARPGEQPHPELVQAAEAYSADLRKWANPSAESMLQSGNGALIRFRQDMQGHARVYPTPAAVRRLFLALTQELDTVDQRLLLSSDRDIVPWYKVDDNLYYAQGTAFAQLGVLKAIRVDFAALFPPGKLLSAMDAAIRQLADSQFEPWVVTNGSKSSLFANHSSNLRFILEEARRNLQIIADGLGG